MYTRSRASFVLLVLTSLGWGQLANAGEPLPSLAELLKQYQEFGLPVPPKDAKLVRYERPGGGHFQTIDGVTKRVVYPTIHGLAFEVKSGTETDFPVLFEGIAEWEPISNPRTKEVKPEPDAVKDLMANYDLLMAMHCHARGWDKLAQYLLERSRKESKDPPRMQLISWAWYFWTDQLTQPKIDRAPIAKRLKALLRESKELDSESNRALLHSLELALVPSKAKPGTVKALIDDLVDYDTGVGMGTPMTNGDRYWRLANVGFDAVPELIEHLDDPRLTRSMQYRVFTMPKNARVGDVVQQLLYDLTWGQISVEAAKDTWKAAISRWFEKARKVGEEAYLLDKVLGFEREGWERQTNDHIVMVILAKYPNHIPTVYRKLLDKHAKLDSQYLADAVLRCNLKEQEKLELLMYAAKHKDYKHRLPALSAIMELDKKKFVAIWLEVIEGLPKDVPGPYGWCPEASIAHLAIESDDPRVWTALERVAKRSDIGFRMELLCQFHSPREKRHWNERLRLLASFLNDADLRDRKSSKKYDSTWAAFSYSKIEVRNFVALEIANLLGIEIEWNDQRTPEEWAAIRNQVQDAVKREVDKKK